ncbi:MAG: hypothetical protein IJ486_04585, partial [Firmicutes bacterium]|nr:hypothetical protein [Bacillota bacterium]
HDEHCCCEHHHDHEHDEHCCCEHHHDHEHDEHCCCEHHHDHEHEHEHDEHCCCEHHHDHEHDEHCCCGHDHHDHHHHHADEVFTSFGAETGRRYTADEITAALRELENEEKYGTILRAKGMVSGPDGFIHFAMFPASPMSVPVFPLPPAVSA